ncbi:MAG: tetratricopeptide repeat protein, partial [Candidatus Atribacteria bacterium]|nr:tetratricopeptide repeat protein [Candidatus Atribacteria bacterium]
GQFSKRIYVKSNDPDHPQIVITVSGFIKEKNESTSTLSSPSSETTTPFMVGKSYFNQGEYDKAIIEFEKSIELDSNHTESYYYLGLCYVQKGIIQYNNKNILAYISLFRKANKISDQVIPQYEKIIKDNPDDLNSYLKLGYIYEVRSIIPFINEYDKALDYYLKALALGIVSESKNTGIYVYLNTRVGSIYFQKKDYPQAIEYLEKAAKMSSHNIEVYYYLGLSYNKIGEKEKALTLFSRVIELAPQSEFAQEAEKEIEKIK